MTEVASLIISAKVEGADKLKSDLNSVSNEAKKAEKSAQGLANSFTGLKTAVAAVAGSAMLREFVRVADDMSLVNSRLKMATSSAAEYAKQQKALHAIARDTHADIKETINLYAKLAPALKNIGKGTEDTNNMASSFTKALQLGGASAEEAAAAIKQFGQAMGSGALRGDEFNSIAEASPTLLRYMAEGLGVNVGKLRELGSEGKLTAEALSNAFEKVKSRIDSDFAQMPVTVGKAFTDLRTEINLIVGDINEVTGATQTISGAITGFANALKENKDTIVGVVSGIGTLVKHLGILGGTYLAIKGSMAAYAAMTTTVAAQTSAGVIQLGFMDRALMKIGVTVGSLKAVFMGFLPTLAIFAAVEAFFALKDSMDKAKPSAEKLNDALSKTNEELQKLTQNQRDAINLDLKASLDANFRKIDEINRKLEEHNKFGGIVGAYRLEADEIIKLKAERDGYIAQNSKIIGQRKEIASINSGIGAIETQQQKDAAYINSLDKKVKDLHVTTLSNLKKEASKLKKEIDEILSKPSDNIRVQIAQEEAVEALRLKLEKTNDQIANFGKKHGGSNKSDNVELEHQLRAKSEIYKEYYEKIGDHANLWLIKQSEISKKLKDAGINGGEFEKIMAQYKHGFDSDLEKKRAAEAEAAHNENIKNINEKLKLQDRIYNLQKRRTELITDETARRIELIEIERAHALEQYDAMLKKGEINKEYYDKAVALENALHQKQIFDASTWGQIMHSGLNGLENAMGNFFDYSSDRFMKFGDLAQDILGQIYRQIVKMMIIQPLINSVTSMLPGMSGEATPAPAALPAGGFASVLNATPAAKGGVFNSPDLHSYANSIVSKPTFFKFAKGGIPDIGVMGEKNGGSPEAIMPLTRTSNGDLGVKAQVGASLNNVKVEVINQTREDVKVSNAAVRQNDGEWVISLVLNGVSKNVLGSRETLRGLLA
ncbi:phage tail tape measure protein [Campylobacter concisus]|uniref:tape measure protein n=1 Tax=Campylobacter concisus TaxID=199 RepID=UPI0018A90495|nr:tape measure protein [Campylobacter concisus]QPI03702.1 phage tail tape measure protein [Campylobacter concisus]